MSKRGGHPPDQPAGRRKDSPPPGWTAEHIAAYDAHMRSAHKSGSTPRKDTLSDDGSARSRPYRVRWKGNDIVLPPAGNGEADAVGFTTWDDSHQQLEAFTRNIVSTRSRRRTTTPVALLHRVDNTYNRRAVSVAAPAVGARATARTPQKRASDTAPTQRDRLRDIKRRHLGYLSDSFLRRVGVESLPALAKLAESRGGEVRCTGIVLGEGDMMLDLPLERIMATAIDGFLAEHGVDAWQRARTHTARSPETVQALLRIRSFAGDTAKIDRISLATVVDEYGHRTVRVTDAETSHRVGAIVDGHLVLTDERNRSQVMVLLGRIDRSLPQSLHPTNVSPDPAAPGAADGVSDLVPNLHARFEPGGVSIETRETNGTSAMPIAVYNTGTKRLWIEDDRLAAAVTTYAARVGLPVSAVSIPEKPWHLTREVPRHMLRDPHAAPRAARDPAVHLRASVRNLVTDDILGPVTWHKHPAALPRDTEPDEQFWFLERHVRERTTLFPDAKLTSRTTLCRLCGQTAPEFTTPITTERVAYCHDCLVAASEGKPALAHRRRTAQAVRELAAAEFDNIPMLEEQLAALHIDPDNPVPATRIDRLLLLRFAVARGKFPWTLVLEESGIAPEGLRTSRGTLVRARDGHLCLSLRERAVCDFLHQHGIKHDREPLYPTDEVLNPRGRRRADWILTDGTLVELWGMPNDPVYAAKMVEKRQLAQRHNLRLIELTDTDLPHLPRLFAPWLNAAAASADGRTAWTWAPALITATPTRTTTETTTGSANSRAAAADNGSNVNARNERTARAQRALELANAGQTRSQIAAEFGVGINLVKELLRDARFYAEPATDPERHSLVTAAAAARRAGRTRTAFASELGLSEKKAKEVWRDAAVITTTDQ
ncbi:hypothetical protein [Nocardioides sp.]|uniref:hypothetical protein n=1 Tax=Nocardioides sp. TaxID=35761 RepID=UPI00271BF3FE|nr:hypothetical protein [Nocardioides sp.]MDO9455258.1 hypothetical protein [Nocardioides sp.]